jgi:hypothetical protein
MIAAPIAVPSAISTAVPSFLVIVIVIPGTAELFGELVDDAQAQEVGHVQDLLVDKLVRGNIIREPTL